jgi:hypothetical protein
MQKLLRPHGRAVAGLSVRRSGRLPFTRIVGLIAAMPLFVAGRATAQAPHAAAPESQNSAAATALAPDSAAKPQGSRFSRLAGVLRRSESVMDAAAARTGVSKETAAHIALTAATGGAATALLSRAAHATAASPAGTAQAAAAPNSLTNQAMAAMQRVAQVSALATQGDPSAKHAIASLTIAMTTPNGELKLLQDRAHAGDATAAQQVIIREAAIIDAALGEAHTGGHP